jgi:hypothetical protein
MKRETRVGTKAIFLAAKNCSTKTAVGTTHSHCKSPSPGFTKILDIFGRSASSNIAQNVQPDLLTSTYLLMWRGWAFSTERTAVCVVSQQSTHVSSHAFPMQLSQDHNKT